MPNLTVGGGSGPGSPSNMNHDAPPLKLFNPLVLYPNSASSPTPPDEVTKKIDEVLGGRPTVVFGGYSGLGYADQNAVKKLITEILEATLRDNPGQRINAVAGATTAGIGDLYSIINDNPHLKAWVIPVGIVSEKAINDCPDEMSKVCEGNRVIVPDPNGTWCVLNKAETHSYTAYAAENNGAFHVLGGGSVVMSEIKAAQDQGVGNITVYKFDPDPKNLEARLAKGGATIESLTPVNQMFALSNTST